MKTKYRKFYTAFKTAWNILKNNTSIMLAVTVIGMFIAGFLTIEGINNKGLTEIKTELYQLFDLYGVESILVFDYLASSLIISVFFVTKNINEDVHTIIMMFLMVSVIMNVVNDFGWVYNIEYMKVLGRVTKVCIAC